MYVCSLCCVCVDARNQGDMLGDTASCRVVTARYNNSFLLPAKKREEWGAVHVWHTAHAQLLLDLSSPHLLLSLHSPHSLISSPHLSLHSPHSLISSPHLLSLHSSPSSPHLTSPPPLPPFPPPSSPHLFVECLGADTKVVCFVHQVIQLLPPS